MYHSFLRFVKNVFLKDCEVFITLFFALGFNLLGNNINEQTSCRLHASFFIVLEPL